MIDIIFLIVFFACWGGIIFIISRKLFFLSSLDVSKIPKEKMAKMKRELLEKKIAREMSELKDKMIGYFKKGLIYLKNAIKLIKKKFKLYR